MKILRAFVANLSLIIHPQSAQLKHTVSRTSAGLLSSTSSTAINNMSSSSPSSSISTMRAIQYTANTDDYSQLKLAEVRKPTPVPGTAIVKIHATSGNPIDYKVMQGHLTGAGWSMPLPFTVGYDFAGVIETMMPAAAVGDSASDETTKSSCPFAVGDAVFAVNWGQGNHNAAVEDEDDGSVTGGAFAEYIRVPLQRLSKKPATVSYEQAAAIALVGSTAYEALFDCLQVDSGSKVLILGGPTAVGAVAIQLAKAKGAWVATTCSTRNLDYVNNQLGVDLDLVVNYREQDWATHPDLQGIDCVFDAVGEKDGFARAVTKGKVIKEGGRFVSIASPDAGFDPTAHQPRLAYGGFFCLYNSPAVQDALAAKIADGTLIVNIDKTFPFTIDGARELLQYIESGVSRGKNVMTMT